MKEAVLILICIILFGCSTFFKRLGLASLHPYQLLLVAGICYAVFTPIWLWLLKSQVPAAAVYPTQSIIFVVIYALINITAGVIFGFLLKNTNSPGSLAAIINLSSLITFGLSYLFLNEQLTPNKIIALVLAILSMIFLNC